MIFVLRCLIACFLFQFAPAVTCPANTQCTTYQCNNGTGACDPADISGTCNLANPCQSNACVNGLCGVVPFPQAQVDALCGVVGKQCVKATCSSSGACQVEKRLSWDILFITVFFFFTVCAGRNVPGEHAMHNLPGEKGPLGGGGDHEDNGICLRTGLSDRATRETIVFRFSRCFLRLRSPRFFSFENS